MSSATGERLFYRSGPWSTPFIIPNSDAEFRIRRRLALKWRFYLLVFMIAQFAFTNLYPDVLHEPFAFIVYIAGLTFILRIVTWTVLASELSKLQRSPTRLSMRSFYCQVAKRHSMAGILLRLSVCSLIATGAQCITPSRMSLALINLLSGIFLILAVQWGYILFLKLRGPKAREESIPDVIQEEVQQDGPPNDPQRGSFRGGQA